MGSYYNCLNLMEDEIHKYIMSNCGKTSKTINYNDLVFNYNDKPNIKRQQLVCKYFIQKDKYDFDSMRCKEIIKEYGLFYNSYSIKNKMAWKIVRDINDYPIVFYNTEFTYKKDYDIVIEQFNKSNIKEIKINLQYIDEIKPKESMQNDNQYLYIRKRGIYS